MQGRHEEKRLRVGVRVEMSSYTGLGGSEMDIGFTLDNGGEGWGTVHFEQSREHSEKTDCQMVL